MIEHEHKFKAKVWIYPGLAAWHFVSLPADMTKKIELFYGDMKRGWGSLPVHVTIGKAKWKTSIFLDKKRAAYILPVKASIRKSESIIAGKEIVVYIQIIV